MEVFPLGLGLVLLGDGPEVKLLCIPMQRSERLVRCYRIVLQCRLSGMESREEAERVEEEEEEESSMELEPEEEEIAMATGDCGFFCATWLWEEDEFAVKRADSG